ncbi:hypothetical protein Pla8534_37680 [Lignipirellula cremea]|uniref:Uncharacterized protein n=2 Tax=Lignipirellula cremea TaxID=2528010 RepID=A0A518DVU0_9BACT|nr:hypothetical protein Pla8534_37680 [Lignipirellula cremea]
MNRPVVEGVVFEVQDAAPREVYFQALAMFRKVNRLCFESVRSTSSEPAPPKGEIRPYDVRLMVLAAAERLQRVKQEFGIVEESVRPPRDVTKRPTDVFHALIAVNRQLNLLLDEKFAPCDVYEQITLAMSYASRLRSRFPGSRIPDSPPLVEGRTSADVYRGLLACFQQIEIIANESGLKILNLSDQAASGDEAAASDLFDLAALLVGELRHLHARSDAGGPLREAYYPGEISFSQLDRRVGLLHAQLQELAQLTRAAREQGSAE